MTIRDYFERIRVINLPERTDRRRDITSELARAGLPLQPGSVEIFPAIRPADAGGFSNIGHHGCFLSHYEVIRQARNAGARNVLIIEDDLAIAPSFQTVAAALVERLQANDWGFVYLGHTEDLKGNGAVTLAPVSSTKTLLTTHFVGVNGRIFDVFLAYLERLRQRPPGHPDGGPMPIDGAYSTFRRQHPDVITLLAVPNLGVQRSSRSDIADPKWFDRMPGLRSCVAALRRTKVWLKGR